MWNIHPVIKPYQLLLLLLLLFVSTLAQAYQSQIEQILQSSSTPEGVVFEIVHRDRQYLDWALPEVDRLSQQLRARFPTLEIAVVSHGSEQFALTRKHLKKNAHLDAALDKMQQANIEVHVCGTYAEYKGYESEAFSPKVNVAAEGPAQIKDYIALGYIHIRLRP